MYSIQVVRQHLFPTAQYIGRGSPLGNPYKIKPGVDRDMACELYEWWFAEQITQNTPAILQALRHLNAVGTRFGKLQLGCYCAPLRCHGETIKRFLENNQDLFDQDLI